MATVNYCIIPCTLSNIVNPFILTCDALSDKPFVTEGSEELGDFRSASDWLTSGTNSFCNYEHGQPIRDRSEG